MKTIAFYLPQFHTIPENDEWWGEGFTEWTNVRKAVSLYENHYQPRVPLNKNYYNLLEIDTIKWQIEIARKYGVYGFCFYHYWFNGKMLLEKPVDNYLEHKELNFPFCLCWANENWTNSWAGRAPKILIGQEEGTEKNWEEHFEYFFPFFQDERYIKEGGKPLLVIYKPDLFPHINEMLHFWNELAKEKGLPGLIFAAQLMPENIEQSCFDMHIEYQPTNVYIEMTKTNNFMIKALKKKLKELIGAVFRIDVEGRKLHKLSRYSYDEIWEKILNINVKNSKQVPGAFVDWDNTPRKKERGYVIEGATPEKFKKYFSLQIKNAKENYKKDYIFLFAWNEWAEGGYLEPDERFQYGYLEALKDALIENGEMPCEGQS